MWGLLGIVLSVFALARADTPANCTYEDIQGAWIFYETERGDQKTADCTTLGPVVKKVRITLDSLNTAVDEFGNTGTWTLIYNQGFEVTVNERVYFAFSKYEKHGEEVISYCDQTQEAWSHDVTIRNWACFTGRKQKTVQPKVHRESHVELKGFYRGSDEFINKINSVQKSWTAKRYERFEGMAHEDLLRMRGGRKSRIHSRPRPAQPSRRTQTILKSTTLPAEFDWRNVDGINYLPPVRDQGSCGSCYAFASMGMVEARIRIMTNNTETPTLSPQDVVSCSGYSQGCSGGFPYLVAGKYAQDFGLVDETCDPYTAKDSPCEEKKCARHYVAKYGYVGGFYGGCNEVEMKMALIREGPLAVAMEVYEDFIHYSGGVYHHVGLTTGLDPFQLTNHAVLLVGFGTDKNNGEPFWTVMNSWGTKWGESGFFRIIRGNDECAIESLGVQVTPIP